MFKLSFVAACIVCSPAFAGETWICNFSYSGEVQIVKFEISGGELIQSGKFEKKYTVLKNNEYGIVAASAENIDDDPGHNTAIIGSEIALIHKKEKKFLLFRAFLPPLGLNLLSTPLINGNCVIG